MARTGVTFEQVVECAKAIESEGENPTIQRIRQRLGTGSPNTIHKHLRAWTAQSQPEKAVTLKLPEKIQDALIAEISRQASEARAESESEAQQAMATADELAEEGERMEAEIEALKQRVEELEQAQIEDGARLSAKDEEVTHLRQELRAERAEAEKARSKIGEDEHKYQAACDQVVSLKKELANKMEELSDVRSELKVAERDATYAQAKYDAQTSKTLHLEDRIEELRNELAQTRTELQGAMKARESLADENTKLQVELASLKKTPKPRQRSTQTRKKPTSTS